MTPKEATTQEHNLQAKVNMTIQATRTRTQRYLQETKLKFIGKKLLRKKKEQANGVKKHMKWKE